MLLDHNIVLYEGMVDVLASYADHASRHALISLVREIAAFAESRHAGVFADGRLENPAFHVGRRLDERHAPRTAGQNPRGGRRHVLHVGTDLPEIGGHTRIAANWIREDAASVHSIALTQHDRSSSLAAAAVASGGTVSMLMGSAEERALQLRALARSADVVVLHVSNRDVVPILALAADDLPPVAVLNHSDHLFWLGSTIADSVINLRSIGRTLSAERRLSRHDSLMAIPLKDPLGRCSRSAARHALGVPESQLMLLSVGRGVKYKPNATHDFFRSAHRILERHRDAHLYVVGPKAAEARGYSTFAAHERLHLIGPRKDATLFQIAADVYIESFPFGSQTACLEVCMCGVPPVLSHTPPALLLTTNEDCIGDLVANPGSDEEHSALVSRLIESPARRRDLGAELRRRILDHHTGEGWLKGLESVYTAIGGLPHRPGAIAAQPCRKEPYDRALATWLDAQANTGHPFPSEPRRMLKRRMEELAYESREAGHYADAFWMLDSSRRRLGLSLDLALFAGKLAPHWLFSMAKRATGQQRPY